MKVIRSYPNENRFFECSEVENGNCQSSAEGNIVNVYDDVIYQKMLGFGGAVTESSAYNYSLLNDSQKKEFIKAYYSNKEGIGYNFGRLHISSCDFSLGTYGNVETGDTTFESFNIERDKKYIIPLVKDILNETEEVVVLFASPWSPPAYMKDNNALFGGGKLLEKYKNLWALHYAKFIKAYLQEGIKISAITVQNEPNAKQTWESCNFTPEEERDFIENNLAPVLDSEGLSDIKIIIWDHNKERVYDRAKTILSSRKSNERVWAVGHHWYTGDHFEALHLVEEQLHKPNICTEFCASIRMTKSLTDLAEHYGREICENINNYCIGICDWNILLNEKGGPYHDRGKAGTAAIELDYSDGNAGCYAPIIYDRKEEKIVLTPVYYYMGHFSKFVKRDARRVATTKYCNDIYTCAFINPNGEKVAVLMNSSDCEKSIILRNNNECTKFVLSAHSISTVLF